MAWRFLVLPLTLWFSSTAFATNDRFRPLWHDGDLACPQASATDRYIQTPLFHDLEATAKVDRIPGLNVFKEAQRTTAGKKMSIYYELMNGWDPNKKLLIIIPGGPGQTHADMHGMVDLYGSLTDLLTKFNIIAMDHRGVGCSRPAFPGNEPPGSMLMRQAASDIDMIRQELVGANGKINVFGYSYGSLLGQTYALLYPDNLERLFIGGTVSSQDDWHLAGVQYESLVFSAVKPEVRDSFNELTKNDLNVREAFLDWSFVSLYQYKGRTQDIPNKLDAVVSKLQAGEKDGAIAELNPEAPDITPWMMRSIACIELFPFTVKYPGEYPMWIKQVGVCPEFKHMTEYFEYLPLLKQIAAPTMIYGGAFDHVTPPKAQIRMAQEIKDSFLFIDSYLGHGFANKAACVLGLSSRFFDGMSNNDLLAFTYSPVCQDPPK